MSVSVFFSGLCGIGEFDQQMGVSMPASEDHKTSVVIKAESCDTDKSTSPDILFNDANGVQFLVWRLNVGEYSLHAGAGRPDWPDRATFIDLNDFHPKAPLKRSASGPFVALSGGSLAAGRDSEPYQLSQGSTVVVDRKACPLSVKWTGDTDVFVATHGSFRVIFHAGAEVFISNLAPSRDSDHHFVHYYHELFKEDPGPEKRISIERLPPISRHVHVFDCVPPVALPEA
jgi:hypothetical protein